MASQDKLKIVYTGILHEGYDASRRDSFEHVNFYLTLKEMEEQSSGKMEITLHPFDRILEVGKKKFNEELLEIVRREKPDLLFAFMYTDELDPAVLMEIKETTATKSVAWFADDYWRFWNYSKHWPPYFTYVVTTYSQAVDWYKNAGYENVILAQWACSAEYYQTIRSAPKDIDVSFVGQKNSIREKIINALRRKEIDVKCFGFGWEGGKLSHVKMLEVFEHSKICLNLTDRKSIWDPSVIARIFLKRSINRIVPDFHLLDNLQAVLHFPIKHTHARPFELAGCGAFVISGRSEDIGKYYEENKEMIFYDDVADLAQKIKYYLVHDAERETIAKNAYARTMREHTYEKRFREIFSKIGV